MKKRCILALPVALAFAVAPAVAHATPEPWEDIAGRRYEDRWDSRGEPYFRPRPGYEQRREFYEEGGK